VLIISVVRDFVMKVVRKHSFIFFCFIFNSAK